MQLISHSEFLLPMSQTENISLDVATYTHRSLSQDLLLHHSTSTATPCLGSNSFTNSHEKNCWKGLLEAPSYPSLVAVGILTVSQARGFIASPDTFNSSWGEVFLCPCSNFCLYSPDHMREVPLFLSPCTPEPRPLHRPPVSHSLPQALTLL